MSTSPAEKGSVSSQSSKSAGNWVANLFAGALALVTFVPRKNTTLTLVNRLKWTSPAAASTSGIYLRTTTQAADGIVISGNQIAGNGLAYGILLAASPNPIGDVTLVGNQLRGATVGLYCGQSTGGLL